MSKIVDEKYVKAKKRVENLKGFYIHLIVYILVNTMLIFINVLNYEQAERWWFLYPLMGWGIGIVCHGLSVAAFGLFGSKWKEKKIREYMEKENQNR